MTPHAFITKWRASASQEHFIDLFRLLGGPTPMRRTVGRESYCFERGAHKDTASDGLADVWKRHHFAWEYKGKRADLYAAFDQLRQYSLALENPPLLIVSDMVRFRIRTNGTNSVGRTHEFELDDLADAATRDGRLLEGRNRSLVVESQHVMTRAAAREQSQMTPRQETVRRVRAQVVRRGPRQSARQLCIK